MWVPDGAAEIEAAAKRGDLEETASFDAKADLPAPKKNASAAVDVAAMSTDGGALLYGIAENEHGRPTIPQPITLAGAADRLGQIIATSISEVPYTDMREYPTDDDPARGYLLVLVPQSARAPHQVIVGGDLRFYGRGAKGNRILTEAEVARLYQRRQDWKQDRDALMAECIAAAPLPHQDEVGYLHAFARPTVPDDGMTERAFDALADRRMVHQTLIQRAAEVRVGGGYSPSLREASYWERPSADEWRLTTRSNQERTKHFDNVLELVLNIDGSARLFSGRGTDHRVGQPEPRYILEAVVVGEVAEFLAVMGTLYRAAGYLGAVDVGVALTNVEGAVSLKRSEDWTASDYSYGAPTFARTRHVGSAVELTDGWRDLTRDLLRHLLEALTGRPDYDPFT